MLKAFQQGIVPPTNNPNLIKLKKALAAGNSQQLSPLADLLQTFTEDDYFHALRQERWHSGVTCPFCSSKNVKRAAPNTQSTPYNYRYICLNCNEHFNDDSQLPTQNSPLPLSTWMQCWYLSKMTDAYQHIANTLNIDVATVLKIIQRLQKFFNSKHSKLASIQDSEFEEQQQSLYSNKISTKALEANKKQVLLSGDTSKQPVDTAEYRKQHDRRTNPKI